MATPDSVRHDASARGASLAKAWFFAAMFCLVFASGLVVGLLRLAPAQWLERSVAALADWRQNFFHYAELRPDKFLHKKRKEFVGVPAVTVDSARAVPGITLVASLWEGQNGFNLYDLSGNVLHRWRVSFNDIWKDTPGWPPTPIGDWDTDIHGMQLYPDGSIVFNFEYNGLVKIDRCSKVVWKLAQETHHSVEMDDAGNLWVPARKKHAERHAQFPSLKEGIEEDLILQVSPDGNVLRTIPLMESLLTSGLAGLVFVARNADLSGQLVDITHLNSVDVLSSQLATRFPQFRAGDLLLSMRNLNLIAVMDPDTGRIKWWKSGSFIQQHDADFLADGTIGLFDNRGEAENPLDSNYRSSRLLRIDPRTGEESVMYASDARNIFFTAIRGNQQFLPGGNVLITEWVAGRVFEVTPTGDIVWQFVNTYDEDEVLQVSQALRYDAHFADFTRQAPCP